MFDRTCVFVETLNAISNDKKYRFNVKYLLKEIPVKKKGTFTKLPACDCLKFPDEPILGFFSGFWITPNIVATALHTDSAPIASISKTRILSKYYNDTYIDKTVTIPVENVFEIEKKLYLEPNPNHFDVVFYQVTTDNQLPESSYTFGTAKKDETIFSIGYPLGLPAKLCKMGKIYDEDDYHFYTDLDSLNGSSGSAVYNSDGEIIGLLLSKGKAEEILIDDVQKCWKLNSKDYKKQEGLFAKVLKIRTIFEQFYSLTQNIKP
jgi:hypothetical protein